MGQPFERVGVQREYPTFEVFSETVEQATTGDGVVETDVCEQHTLEKLYIESVRRLL